MHYIAELQARPAASGGARSLNVDVSPPARSSLPCGPPGAEPMPLFSSRPRGSWPPLPEPVPWVTPVLPAERVRSLTSDRSGIAAVFFAVLNGASSDVYGRLAGSF